MATITANDGGQPAPLRQWLDQIVATLPESRQQMYDVFVARGLDSRNAARELGTSVAEVRRLRSENQQAILRAFEVTALAAAQAGQGLPGIQAPGCGQLRRLLADAQPDDGDLRAGGRRRAVVLPAALRLSVSRHLGQCLACQGWRDDCMTRWTPELLPILAYAEVRERVTQDAQSMPEPPQADAPSRVGSAGTGGTVVVRPPAAAAAGAGLLAALLLLAFVWPGVLHWTRGSTAASSQHRGSAAAIGNAPTVTGTFDGVPGRGRRRPARPGTAGLRPAASQSSAALSSAAMQPSVFYTVQPSSAPTSSPAQPGFGPPSTGWPATQSPSPAPPKTSSPTPSAAPSTTPPTAPSSAPPSKPVPTPTPTPTAPASTPTPTPTPTVPPSAPAPTPSASSSEPAPTASATAPTPPSASLTAAPSASSMS